MLGFFIAICDFWQEKACGVCELAFPVVKTVPVDLGEGLFPL